MTRLLLVFSLFTCSCASMDNDFTIDFDGEDHVEEVQDKYSLEEDFEEFSKMEEAVDEYVDDDYGTDEPVDEVDELAAEMDEEDSPVIIDLPEKEEGGVIDVPVNNIRPQMATLKRDCNVRSQPAGQSHSIKILKRIGKRIWIDPAEGSFVTIHLKDKSKAFMWKGCFKLKK